MGAKKPMALHTSHHTKEELAIMEAENEAAKCKRTFLNDKPPKELIDKKAREIWRNACVSLKDLEIIGDLDVYAIIGFCNSLSLYYKTTDELAAQPLCIDGKANPLINIQIKYASEVRAFAVKAGISVNARLTYASLQVKDTDNEINNEFGL